MEKVCNYVLHPLVDEIPLAGAVKFKFKQDSEPFFVVPRRYSLDFYLITKNGIEPKNTVPWQKSIKYLFVMAGKHFGLSKVDVLVVVFYDSSFVVFNDPKAPLLSYEPNETNANVSFLADIYKWKPAKPLMVMSDKNNLIKFWDGSSSKVVYKLRVVDGELLDMKFLSYRSGTSPTLSVLYKEKTGDKKIITYSIDTNLLRLVKIDTLSKDIDDEDAKLIIPLPSGDVDRPSFIVLGSKVTCVPKKKVTTSDLPFKGLPTAFCSIAGWKYLVADESGQIMLLDVTDQVNVTVLGSVDTVITSITHIDGDYFHIGSTVKDSYYVKIRMDGVTTLLKMKQFRPVCDVSLYSNEAGAIYMSHGTGRHNDGGITSVRIGASFSPDIVCSIPEGVSILAASISPDYLIVNTFDRSHCLKIDENNNLSTIVPSNFNEKAPTINAFPCKGFFIQLTKNEMRICNSNIKDNVLSFNDDIIAGDYYRDKAFILFNDRVECITTKLEKKWTHKLTMKHPKCIATYKTFTYVVSWSGEILYLDNNKEVENPADLKIHNSVPSSVFIMKSDIMRLCIAYADGTVNLYKIPQLVLIKSLTFGHYISGCFQTESNTVFINGASPSLLNVDGTSIQAIIDNYSSGCGIKSGVAFFGKGQLSLGKLNESNLTQIETKSTEYTPYILELHNNPPSLFTASYNDGKCGIHALSIPHMIELFSMDLEEDEEVNCLLSLPELSMMAVGTSGRGTGRLILIKDDFGELHPVAQIEVCNGIYALTQHKGFLLAGGQCRIFVYSITISPAGAIVIKEVSAAKVPVRTRSLVTAGDTIVHFDSKRAITTFKLTDDNIIEAPTDFLKPMELLSGFVSPQISPNVYHLYAADDKGYLHIYRMKTRDVTTKQPKIKEIGKICLSSQITSMKLVREGFSVITTESGGVFLLIQLSPDDIQVLHNVEKTLTGMSPILKKAEKVINSSVVSLYLSLPLDKQNEIAEKCILPRGTIIEKIKQIKSRSTKLCSTQK